MNYKGLTFETDIRRDPAEDDHNHRLGAFKAGWTKATKGRQYDGVLDKLTWDNLGWRLGKLFGETSEEQIEELFDWCVDQRDDTANEE